MFIYYNTNAVEIDSEVACFNTNLFIIKLCRIYSFVNALTIKTLNNWEHGFFLKILKFIHHTTGPLNKLTRTKGWIKEQKGNWQTLINVYIIIINNIPKLLYSKSIIVTLYWSK